MSRGRLFRETVYAEADVRPTLLGIATLLFLLLFFLLSTSSGMRLGVIGLRLGSAADLAPLPHAGLLQRVRVTVEGATLAVEAQIQTTDIAAAATSVERRRFELPPVAGAPDVAGLARVIDELHGIDRAQLRAELAPDDAVPTETVVAVLDAIRGSDRAPRFPQVTLVGVEGG